MACEFLLGLYLVIFLIEEEYFVVSLDLGFGGFFLCINKVTCNTGKWTLSSLFLLWSYASNQSDGKVISVLCQLL